MYPKTENLRLFLHENKHIRVVVENDSGPSHMLYSRSWMPVLCYVLKFLSDSQDEENDDAALLKTIRLLEDSANRIYSQDEDEDEDEEYSNGFNERSWAHKQAVMKVFLQDFVPQVQKYFLVPIQTSSVQQLKQNEILAVFLDFLLQIWNTLAHIKYDETKEEVHEVYPPKVKHDLHDHQLYLVRRLRYKCDGCDERGQGWSYRCKGCDFVLHPRCGFEGNDEIWNMQVALVQKNQKYALAHMELKFLLTYLGDVPFQFCTPHGRLQKHLNILLAEIEILANQAGHFTLVYILALDPDRFTEFDKTIDTLMQKAEHLNENIKQYCITFSELIPMHVTITPMVTRPIDSLFILDSLLEDLESLIDRRLHLTVYEDMEDQIAVLYKELKLSRAFLKNTKFLREMNCFIVIREIAYEAEYLIKSYIVGYIPIWYLRLRLPAMIQKLNLNRSRLEEIKLEDDVLQITTDFTTKVSLRPMEKTSITVVEDHLVGIENSKKEVLAHLIGHGKALKIISLVGMPGLGKTTLAKSLFDSSSIQNHFDRRAWCVISQNYVKRNVFLDILMTIVSKDEKQCFPDLDDECLGLRIHKSLHKRRYIIVVDDIWSSSTWDDMRHFFPDDYNGSRIIITSRIKSATPIESIFHEIQFLSPASSMDLLVKKVFLNESCPKHLVGIGNKIAKGCNGLPLVVVVIAGILANLDRTENAWEKVEKDLDTFVLDVQDDCARVLEFSYEHLSDHLKMCFLYLGTFPEDSEIAIGKILRLWIAEGFIERTQKNRPEDVAKEYLHDLINRSLVVIVKRKFNGAIKACGLHDLLRDLCLRKADETGFRKYTKKPFSMYVRHHRLLVDSDEVSSHFGLHCCSFSGNNLSDASSCFPQMPLHRVINLSRYNDRLQQVKEIDMLVHLRYLCAPDGSFSLNTARNLVNLEVLDVSHLSENKIELSTILKMVKLKHLKIKEGSMQIINDCNDRCEASNLQSLSSIKIHSLKDEGTLKYFPHLRKLRMMLWHSRFPNISSTVLETLRIDFMSDVKIDFTTVIFPSSIKELTLQNIGLPWDEMSVIGRLQNLQVLILLKNAFVGEKWETMDGEFQKLSYLRLVSISSLEQWITSEEHFPELQCLVLRDCKYLQDISSDLGNIQTLQKIEVENCSYNLSKSAIQIEEEQHEMENEQLQVGIINEFWEKNDLVHEYREMKRVFRLLDEGCTTSSSELLRVMTSIGINPSEPELQRMINAYADRNIDFPDFLDLVAGIRIPYSDNLIRKAFKFFDRKKRGFTYVNSLHYGLRELGQGLSLEEVEKMVRQADTDGDGKLNLLEFNKLMMTIDIPRPRDLRTALLWLKEDDR